MNFEAFSRREVAATPDAVLQDGNVFAGSVILINKCHHFLIAICHADEM
jgi:hypothetical protein